MDFSDSTIAEESQDDSAAEGLTELNEDFNKDDSVVEDLTEEDFSKEDFSKDDSAESFNKRAVTTKTLAKMNQAKMKWKLYLVKKIMMIYTAQR